MERRKFIQRSLAASGILSLGLNNISHAQEQQQKEKELYELRVYEMTWGTQALDDYLTHAFIPALNRIGVKKVGVFTEMSKNEPVKLYVLIPYQSFEHYGKVTKSLKDDREFENARSAFDKLTKDQQVYHRYESSLLLAFDGLPQMIAPNGGQRIFELRTYEGYSEDAVKRKIAMFNDEEFDIFYRVKLNPVFFGEMISGKNRPSLVYMITFKDMEERNKNWEAFGKDTQWQKISHDEKYKDTVSKIYKTFLEPVPYSQI